MPSFSRRQLVVLVLLTLVWGFNWPVMKVGVEHFPPLSFRMLSLWTGLPILALVMLRQGLSFRMPRAYWGRLLLLALTNMVLWHALMILAMPLLSSGRAAILGYTMPIFSAVIGAVAFGDRLAGRAWAGVGAAAHSYLDGQRYENPRGIEEYLAALRESGRARREEEPLTRATSMEEFAFLALRTARGIDRARFAARFGCELASVYADAIARMRARGFLEEDAQGVRLTPLGMKYGNWVFEAFLLDA